MAIEFSCPDCGKAFSAKDDRAGEQIECPACHREFRVPRAVKLASKAAIQALDDHVAGAGEGLARTFGAIGMTLAWGERLALRLMLYAMVFRGIMGDYPHGDQSRMSWMLGVVGLAIVSRLPARTGAGRGPGVH